jgi:hypothetical protein
VVVVLLLLLLLLLPLLFLSSIGLPGPPLGACY